jgi:hypothetical protein
MAKLWGFLAVFFMVLAVAFAVLGAWRASSSRRRTALVRAWR